MKLSKSSKIVVLGLAVLLATSAFASSSKGSLQVTNGMTIAGKQLPAGEYKVQWDGSGPDVEVNIMHGNKVVATVPAHLIELAQSPNGNAAVTKTTSDGTKAVSEIRFSGKKYALALGDESANASSSGSTK
jgi:hypothetical protein